MDMKDCPYRNACQCHCVDSCRMTRVDRHPEKDMMIILYTGKCKIAYHRGNVDIVAMAYDNHRVAMQLFALDGEPIATATVNLPDEKLGPDEICVKDYAENAGMREFLVRAEIVEPDVVRFVHSGYVDIPVMKLTLATQRKLLETT